MIEKNKNKKEKVGKIMENVTDGARELDEILENEDALLELEAEMGVE
jgi:hypothetical protein